MKEEISEEVKVSMDYCPKDYKNRHCFSRVGVTKNHIIYLCSQCGYSFGQPLKFIEKRSCCDEARRDLIEELEKEITYGENAELYNYETLCAKDLWDNIQEWIDKKKKELQP